MESVGSDHHTMTSANTGVTGITGMTGGPGREEAASVNLHELAKGWKAAIARATDPATRHEAQIKNDRGNLPLHSAASFRAPLEVSEALLEAYPEAASMTNNYGNLALHFTAWKKGPLDVERLLLRVFPEGAAQKNNHGNLPLHYAAHYNAPLEVVEALYNAYPEGAYQKNNDSNTPLDLAIADGASPNVVSLLQGKSVPPTDDEMFEGARGKCERMEKELQRGMESHDLIQEELESVLGLLMDVRDGHPHALYSAGIDPTGVADLDSLLEQVHKAGDAERRANSVGRSSAPALPDESQIGGSPFTLHGHGPPMDDGEEDLQAVEDALIPPDDEVEVALSKVVGLDHVKNQVRGLRRTIELERLRPRDGGVKGVNGNVAVVADRILPRHLSIIGNPGSGKTYVSRILAPLLFRIGAVPTPNFVEVGRDELVDRKSESRTIQKTQRMLEKASGGVLFVDEAYTLLPSVARPRGRDHGAAALKEIARSLPSSSPLVILAGYPGDLQRVMVSNIGFRGNFLLKVELPDPTPAEVSRIFLMKLGRKGLVPGEGLSVGYLADLIESHTDEDWRAERNGRVAELLLQAVRGEVKRRVAGGETDSRGSIMGYKPLSPLSQKGPVTPPEEVVVTVEDVQNAVMNGL